MDAALRAWMEELAALGRKVSRENPEFAASARRAFHPRSSGCLIEDASVESVNQPGGDLAREIEKQ